MAHANIENLHHEWQSAVEAHAAMIRAGKISGLTARELDEVGQVYVLRIDAAFARLKQAEAECEPLTPSLWKEASSALPQ
jgi:hypothetical protein